MVDEPQKSVGGSFGRDSRRATGEEDAEADPVSGIAEQSGITPDIAQAVMALIAGQLASRQAGGGDEAKSAGLDELLEQARGGQAVDETALKASGLPQNLAKSTGLELSEAIRVLQKLLPSLAALLGLPGAKPAHKPKPKPKPRPAAKPKPATKPKPSRRGIAAETICWRCETGSQAQTQAELRRGPNRRPAPPNRSQNPAAAHQTRAAPKGRIWRACSTTGEV